MSQHSKECCNKVEELEVEISVTTKENYITTKDERERIEDCHDIVYFMSRHIQLMSQHKARLQDKKLCRNREIYVTTCFNRSKE